MRAAVIALGALLGCGPVAGGAGSTLPGGVLDRMTTLDDVAALIHAAADHAPPPPPPKAAPPPKPAPPPRPRFTLPESAPRGAPHTVPAYAIARGDRRRLTLVDHWTPDGRPPRRARYVVDERIGDVRNGRPYVTWMDVVEAEVLPALPPPIGPSERLPRGAYYRLAEEIMIGDAEASHQFFRGDSIFDGPSLEQREFQTLHDLTREEEMVDRLLIAVRQQPLRVGETVDVWTHHLVADRIHRAADRGPLTRYILTSAGSRRVTLDVDGRGRPIRCFMEFYSSTIELTYGYER